MLRVSRFDRVVSLFLAVFSLTVGVVLGLFVVWLTASLVWVTPPPPMQLLNYSGQDNPPGFEFDVEPPGLEELSQVAEPSLAASLEAVTDELSTQAAAFDVTPTSLRLSSLGDGAGDTRPPGPPGPPSWKLVHPSDRWEIRFHSSSIQTYARQLDHFGIELCAYGGGTPTIDFVSHVSQPRPTVVSLSEPPQGAQGVFVAWRGGPLLAYDQQLMAQAGIATQGRVLTQHYPVELRQRMERMEADFSRQPPSTWLKTIWVVDRRGDGWELQILDMYYRPTPRT